ncbi:hypothetical protein [Streptomyces sp. H23]|uniref:hypothetical protein n=1 Tax=Streptomyces TaxID=1883 RepID=UPI0014305598|nr:hypothetical protein [Streptomyces sp. H23]
MAAFRAAAEVGDRGEAGRTESADQVVVRQAVISEPRAGGAVKVHSGRAQPGGG